MLNENAQKWVDALRSGEYEQGRGYLTIIRPSGNEQHCCLGVACLVAMKNGVELDIKLEEHGVKTLFKSYNGDSTGVPYAVQDWLGLSENTGDYHGNSINDALTDQNDGGASFEEIADIIENKPEKLFKAGK